MIKREQYLKEIRKFMDKPVIKVFPLSFKEFIKFSKIQNPQKIYTTEEYFEQYLKFGGLPAIHNFSQDKTSIYQYLTDIYNSVLLKDVISRNNIRDIELLERVILFIFDNIGNTFSAKKISDFYQGRKLSTETVYNYLKAHYFKSSKIRHKRKIHFRNARKILSS